MISPGIIVGVGSGIGLADQIKDVVFDRLNFPEMPAALLAPCFGILIGGLVVLVCWQVLTFWKQSLIDGIARSHPAEVNAMGGEAKLDDPTAVQTVLREAGRSDCNFTRSKTATFAFGNPVVVAELAPTADSPDARPPANGAP